MRPIKNLILLAAVFSSDTSFAQALAKAPIPNSATQATLQPTPTNDSDSGVGTLKRIEMLMREKAESDVRAKSKANAAMELPLSGIIQAPALNPTAKKNRESASVDKGYGESELSGYRTKAIVNFNGNISADILYRNEVTTYLVGEPLDTNHPEWIITRISINGGVQVEKKVVGKKGAITFSKYVLQSSRGIEDNTPKSIAALPVLNIDNATAAQRVIDNITLQRQSPAKTTALPSPLSSPLSQTQNLNSGQTTGMTGMLPPPPM